jgi:hypothetical protein
MKTINKIMIGLVLATLAIVNVNAQPKSEIPDDNKPKMNWSGADTLFTFQFNTETNSWLYFQREIRRFDNENPIENFVQIWENQKWINYLRVNYSYDENGNEIEEITQDWDSSTNTWVNAQLKTSSYKGRQKEEILFQQWKKPTNEWFNIMKYLIKYNLEGEKNEIAISLFNGVTKNWDNHKRFLMDFDLPYGPPTTVVAESWYSNSWKTDGKYEILYNWRGKKTNEVRYTWNQGKHIWMEGIMLEMAYDKSGNQTEYVEKKFDYANNNWMNFNKFSAAYNEEGNMIEKTEYKWDRITSQWNLSGQFKFTTDTKI